VGGGLGAATPPIWRIGLMGPNAKEDTADEVLAALTAVLEGGRVPVAG
jgi:aspartate aminotransferase-like enzyme